MKAEQDAATAEKLVRDNAAIKPSPAIDLKLLAVGDGTVGKTWCKTPLPLTPAPIHPAAANPTCSVYHMP